MENSSPKRLIAAAAIVLVIAIFGGYLITRKPGNTIEVTNVVSSYPKQFSAGKSVEGRDIKATTYLAPGETDAAGKTAILFVGGIHGGYEWNSVLLAYQFMDYLGEHPEVVPKNVAVTVLADANPDAIFKVTGKEGRFTLADVNTDPDIQKSARFNANEVDLNRNFDCKWQPKSTWQSKTVSAGTEAFSEPEARAVRDLAAALKPKAAIFWHSQANAVYASECKDGILPADLTLMKAYAKAAGYPAVDSFDAYPVTGDAEGYLASIGIPAITVELKTHENIEWDKNLAGIKAVLELYGNKTASSSN